MCLERRGCFNVLFIIWSQTREVVEVCRARGSLIRDPGLKKRKKIKSSSRNLQTQNKLYIKRSKGTLHHHRHHHSSGALTRPGEGVHKVPRGLQRPLGHPPEQRPSLRRRHGVGALQQVADDEGLLGAGRLGPQPAVHPDHQLTRDQLLQVGQDLAVGGQQPGGDQGSGVRAFRDRRPRTLTS